MRALLLVGIALFAWACGGGEESGAEHDAGHPHDHGLAEAPAPAAPSGHSIFHLPSRWTTHRGDEIQLSNLGGRVQVLAMVYTHCQAACPRILADMRWIRARVDRGAPVGFVLVSIDPERDTPERLAAFADESGLAGDDWLLLRGSDEDVRELAAVLGVRYRRVSEGDFSHSNLISVLDPQGVVVHRQIGLGVDVDQTVEAIDEQLAN